jgi:pterin-4a-carbinolamine dehydratase
MSGIDDVLKRIKPILEELQHSRTISTKVSFDKDAQVIQIYGEGSNFKKRASFAISEVLELAYTTAEHHPYWLLLYHSVEICKMTIDNWDSELNEEYLSEMSWRCDEIKMALERLAARS